MPRQALAEVTTAAVNRQVRSCSATLTRLLPSLRRKTSHSMAKKRTPPRQVQREAVPRHSLRQQVLSVSL
jgi:hypothetical protein